MAMLMAGSYFDLTFSGQFIVPPGSAITVSVGTGSITASANIRWWEQAQT
jgi:hypothetical protein